MSLQDEGFGQPEVLAPSDSDSDDSPELQEEKGSSDEESDQVLLPAREAWLR